MSQQLMILIAGPYRSGTNDDPNEPKIINGGDASRNESLYPARAKRWGVEGWAMVNATLDEEGHVTSAQVVEQYPADASYGFAEAATKVAMGVRFANKKGQPTQVKFRVKFALAGKHAMAPPNLDSPRAAR